MATGAVLIEKKPTGIAGFDDLSEGGLPAEGLTAIVGNPGSGKTVFAFQTLVNGFAQRGERGILVLFEEQSAQIRANFSSFAWGLAEIGNDDIRMIDARLPLDAIRSGLFDLSALLSGLATIIEESGARTVVFDGLDMLLSALNDEAFERQEIVRLGKWVRDTRVRAMVTVKVHGASTRDQRRADFLQYMTDCIVVLDGLLVETSYSRTLRISKYRGSGFSANPVPIVIGASGLEVVGFKGERLGHPAHTDRVSSGVALLDARLGGGYIRGTCTLVSGAPGTSKTSLAASFVVAACLSGLRALYVSFDEGGAQIVANMNSIGLDLAVHVQSGLLVMESLLSSSRSAEEHYVVIRNMIDRHRPAFLVIDPLSGLSKVRSPFAELVCETMLDQAKSDGITVLCTSLLEKFSSAEELSASHVSTVADTWLHVSYLARDGERNRALTIVKSRGTSHSNQVCELVLGAEGIELVDVYAAEGEVLMGSARRQRQARDRREHRGQEMVERRRRFELDKSVAELRMLADKAAQDLDWKIREAALFDLNQKSIHENEHTDAEDRLNFRANRPETVLERTTSVKAPEEFIATESGVMQRVATTPSSGPLPLLRLYVARSTPNSVRAEQNLRAALSEVGAASETLLLEIIDVFTNGKRAIIDGVMVTPTLVVIDGDKRHTIVGDLTDASPLRALLNSFPSPRRDDGKSVLSPIDDKAESRSGA